MCAIRPVEKMNGVGAPGGKAGDTNEKQVHGLSFGIRHGTSRGGSPGWTCGAKEIGILTVLIGWLVGP